MSLQVGETVWDEAPRAMRTQLWMSALVHASGSSGVDVEKYNQLLSKVREMPR